MGSTADDPNKPVTGYPTTGYPPPQTSYHNHQHQSAGYPPAENSYPATGTGYPYTAPPPAAAYYNPNPYPPTNYDTQRTTFVRRVIIAGISVFVIIGAITLILWLVIRPRLPEFRVNSASVSNFNVSSSQLTSNWEFGLLVTNPNKKMTIFYDHMEGSVFYKDEYLTGKTLPPFYQNKKSETNITALFTALSTYVDDRTAKEMVRDRNGGGVSFNLRMLAWVRFRYGIWRRRHLVRVFCEDVKIGFSSNTDANGRLLGGTKKCEVHL